MYAPPLIDVVPVIVQSVTVAAIAAGPKSAIAAIVKIATRYPNARFIVSVSSQTACLVSRSELRLRAPNEHAVPVQRHVIPVRVGRLRRVARVVARFVV